MAFSQPITTFMAIPVYQKQFNHLRLAQHEWQNLKDFEFVLEVTYSIPLSRRSKATYTMPREGSTQGSAGHVWRANTSPRWCHSFLRVIYDDVGTNGQEVPQP